MISVYSSLQSESGKQDRLFRSFEIPFKPFLPSNLV